MWYTMWWTAINRCWRRLCADSFATGLYRSLCYTEILVKHLKGAISYEDYRYNFLQDFIQPRTKTAIPFLESGIIHKIYAETDADMVSEAVSRTIGKQPIRMWESLSENDKLKVLGFVK